MRKASSRKGYLKDDEEGKGVSVQWHSRRKKQVVKTCGQWARELGEMG